MEIRFAQRYLFDLYHSGQSKDKKHRFQPHIVRKYAQIIRYMQERDKMLELCQMNSLNYEKLIGNKAGLSSVRVNQQYSIEFEEHLEEGKNIATICNITELSNHYD